MCVRITTFCRVPETRIRADKLASIRNPLAVQGGSQISRRMFLRWFVDRSGLVTPRRLVQYMQVAFFIVSHTSRGAADVVM